jgi:beta-glucosidase
VLRAKFALGLFDHPYVDTSLTARVKRNKEHLALSLQSARESMTLLKNDGRLLPLSKTLKRIALIGPNAAIARYGDYEDEKNGLHISIADGLKRLMPNAAIAIDDGANIEKALADAREADVVILALGEYQGISGEGSDRLSLDLPGNQEQLLEAIVATGKSVILVLENGRPLTIPWAAEHVPAILEAWYPGEFGGQAVAETLFGDNNRGGKLTITFPKSIGQLPVFYNFDPSKTNKYVEGDRKPLFPFGFGLSFTSFQYDHLSVQPLSSGSKDDLVATVTVTNTGSVEGDEIAQLYLHHDVSSVEVADRALKDFSRIHLKPGESKRVEFHVKQSDLAVWSRKQQWVVEPGTYTLFAGGSSDATLATKFKISR